jgi:hypothetical protein
MVYGADNKAFVMDTSQHGAENFVSFEQVMDI